MKDLRQIVISFPLPDLTEHYKSKVISVVVVVIVVVVVVVVVVCVCCVCMHHVTL